MRLIKFSILAFSLILFNEVNSGQVFSRQKKPKTIVILSIDGGGVRGIVPAIILRAIEKKLPLESNLGDYFHIMSGTSTGALICLMLNKPSEFGRYRYKMLDIIRMYESLSNDVFSVSWWQKIVSVGGWKGAKYNADALEENLRNYLGYTKLSETPTNVLIPAFDLKSRCMKFFRTSQAKEHVGKKDYYIKDIARATTSAPTYFEAAYIKNLINEEEGIYVDGGVGVNNPSVAAVVHALEIYGKGNDIFVLSIGTGTPYFAYDDNVKKLNLDIHDMGKLDWATNIIDVLMDANTDVTHFYAMVGLSPKYYYRLQINIDKELMTLDDGSPVHMRKLAEITNSFIHENDKLLSEIADTLIRLRKNNN